MLLRRMIDHVREQNWAAVAIDFVIVVVGVGLALIAEQWISNSQQRAEYRVAESSLRSDVFSNYLFAQEHIALRECRRQNLREIVGGINQEEWEPLPTGRTRSLSAFVFPAIYATPSRPWGSRTWDAELGRGTLSGLDVEQRAQLGLYFHGASIVSELQTQILAESANLKSLAILTELSSSDRARYLDTVMRIDNNSAVMELIAQQMIAIVENYQDVSDYSEDELANMRQGIDQLSAAGQAAYGECYQPISSPFVETEPTE